jgi:hypothetical protein
LLAELKRVKDEPDTGPFGSASDDNRREAHAGKLVVRSSPRRMTWLAFGLMIMLPIAIAAASILYRRARATTPASTPAVTVAPAANAKLYAQMSEAEQLSFIKEQEQRISAMMGDRPAKLSEEAIRAIKIHLDGYLARDAKPRSAGGESLKEIYARAPQYVPLIARSFSEHKVPVIIGIYLPMIESAYRPCTESDFGSKGLYQFLPQTAKLYGVAPEEMCDAKKMTPAAAQYIADHMAELGDDAESMTLVLLSYNRGATWVRSTLRQLRDTDNYERNFWTLFAHRDQLDQSFRNESAAYVPNFFAAAIIGENPATFELPEPALSRLAEGR